MLKPILELHCHNASCIQSISKSGLSKFSPCVIVILTVSLSLLLQQQYKFVHECLACALNKDDGYGRNGKAQFVEVGGPVNKGFDGQ